MFIIYVFSVSVLRRHNLDVSLYAVEIEEASLPREYEDFGDVFSKDGAEELLKEDVSPLLLTGISLGLGTEIE